VASFLQTWALTGEGSKDRLATESGQTGAMSFVDGRGDNGSTWEGLRQRGDGGEQSMGLRPEFEGSTGRLFIGEIDPERTRCGLLAIPTEICLQITTFEDIIQRAKFYHEEDELRAP
jgi:hypothetical protein